MLVGDAVAGVLRGPMTVREIVAALRQAGHHRVPRSAVETTLADDPRFEADGRGPKARWRPTGQEGARRGPRASAALAPAVAPGEPLTGLELRDWQVEAFAAWAAAGCRGVVEAVTGTGKTRLAIAATRACLARDGRVLVLVPTLDLADQWLGELRRLVPGAQLGRLGGGGDADLHEAHVVVATPHSAAAVPVDVPAGRVGLLVADEAHRYGAPTWAGALRPDFAMRLALTATYERSDDEGMQVLGDYFGGVVCSYGYDRAVPDGVVAPFRVAFVGTDLEDHERAAYDAADARVRETHRLLLDLGLPKDPRRLIQAAAGAVAEAEGGSRGRHDVTVEASRAYLAGLRRRRDVAATCAGKLDVVTQVGPALAAGGARALVFTDTVDQAEQAARLLSRAGLAAEELHGGLPDRKRRIRLAQFRNGNLDAVVAPRVLDEGVDVPDADVAVVLSSFRTRRQMIQRLGRVLRLKPDGRCARLVVAYARDTREDPGRGGHDDFLAEVLPVAEEVAQLERPADVHRWLAR